MVDLIINTGRRRIIVLVPEGWNELSGAQLVSIAGIITADMDPLDRDLQFASIITSIDLRNLSQYPPEIVAENILPLASWITEACDLTSKLLPAIAVNKTAFHGPQDHLRNMRFGEFDAAERMLHAWHQARDNVGLLWQFAAILYRPLRTQYDLKLNPDGDLREPFNGNLTEHYAQQLSAKLPVAYAYAIMLFYKGCRGYISERFDRIFKAAGADQSEVDGEPAYFGLMRAIAKEGAYGTFEDVEQLYLYTALTEMEAALDEREALDRAIAEANENK